MSPAVLRRIAVEAAIQAMLDVRGRSTVGVKMAAPGVCVSLSAFNSSH
jgi:hypothetical protein